MTFKDGLEKLEWLNSFIEEEQEAQFELTDDMKTELDRRIAEHEADPDSAIPWEEVRKKLRGRG